MQLAATAVLRVFPVPYGQGTGAPPDVITEFSRAKSNEPFQFKFSACSRKDLAFVTPTLQDAHHRDQEHLDWRN